MNKEEISISPSNPIQSVFRVAVQKIFFFKNLRRCHQHQDAAAERIHLGEGVYEGNTNF